MLCIGSTIAILIAGRVLQGFSAAIVWTTGMALLVDTVGQRDVGQAIGYVGLAMSVAILVAPLLGGVVFASAGYYAVFAMAFALIAVDIVLRVLLVERKVAVKWLRVDEDTTASGGGEEESGKAIEHQKEQNSEKPCPLASTGGDLGLKLEHEAEDRKPRPNISSTKRPNTPSAALPPPRRIALRRPSIPQHFTLPPIFTLLSSRRLLAALYGSLIQAALLTAFDSVLPLHVHSIFSWGPLAAGLVFLPVTIPSFIGPLSGWASDRYGPRWLATSGFVLACPCLILLRLVTYNSLSQKVLLCVLLALFGLAMSLSFSPLMAEISYVVSAKEERMPGVFGEKGAYAQAYGLFNVAFAGGCLVGPIWGGLINERAGWGTMSWTLGLLSAVTAVPTALWVGGWIGGKEESERRKRRLAEVGDGEGG